MVLAIFVSCDCPLNRPAVRTRLANWDKERLQLQKTNWLVLTSIMARCAGEVFKPNVESMGEKKGGIRRVKS